MGLASPVARASISLRPLSLPARLRLAERNVSHDRLWAPWRLGYIQGKDPPAAPMREVEWLPGADPQCFLCLGAAGGDDRANLVVARGKHTLVVLNRYPYNNGHLLVAPLAPVPALAQFTPDLPHQPMENPARFTDPPHERMN